MSAGHLRQVIIAGRAGAPDTEALLDAAHAPFVPDKARTTHSQQRCLERIAERVAQAPYDQGLEPSCFVMVLLRIQYQFSPLLLVKQERRAVLSSICYW